MDLEGIATFVINKEAITDILGHSVLIISNG